MKTIKVAIIGAGNISNTRHIPALHKLKNVEIMGVVGVRQKNIDRTLNKYDIPNHLLIEDGNFETAMRNSEWFLGVDAVVIGAPPREHYVMVEASLNNGKHVLVEKPMTMNEKEADELINLAQKKKKILSVMHNFQFAANLAKLEKLINTKDLGDIVSFSEFQLSNKNRRLPEWYNDLPLGLFYDEAPHFMYLLEKFGGELKIKSAFAHPSSTKNDNTPSLLSVALNAGKYPANLFLNFEAPICEWYFVVNGTKKIAFYDLFKDILILLPTDNEHYAGDVLRTSLRTTAQHWKGFMVNGINMLRGNLLYGHEVVMKKYIAAVSGEEKLDPAIDATAGKRTVKYMHDIINKANQEKKHE